jgi:hypothetical protein
MTGSQLSRCFGFSPLNAIESYEEHLWNSVFNYSKAAPDAYKAISGLEAYLHGWGLEEGLLI